MATVKTVEKVKTDLRIRHSQLDDDIIDQIDACLHDLEICGVIDPSEDDVTILNAIKLFVRAQYTDEPTKASAYMERYNAMKGTLMMAEGYGGRPINDD